MLRGQAAARPSTRDTMRSSAFASLRLITISISCWQDSWVGRLDFVLGRADSARKTIRSEETRQTTSSPRPETAAPRRVRRDCAPPRARRERHERPYHPPQMYLRRPEPSRGGQHETKSPCCSSAEAMTATDDGYLAASRNAVLSRISRPASAFPPLRCAPRG